MREGLIEFAFIGDTSIPVVWSKRKLPKAFRLVWELRGSKKVLAAIRINPTLAQHLVQPAIAVATSRARAKAGLVPGASRVPFVGLVE